MKVSVVIPAYNEEKRIEESAKKLDGYLKGLFDDYEIIFCSDGSTDSTFEKAKKLENENEKIKAVGYETNRGKGCAVRTGMLASDGDIVIFTDCDLAYGLDVIKKAVDKFEQTGAQLVIGSRNLDSESYKGYSFARKFMSRVYFKLISLMTGFKQTDSQCGFKCFSKEAAHTIFSECKIDSFAFDLEALLMAQDKGYKIEEIAVKIINNDNRNTKVRMISDSIRMLKDIRTIKKNQKSHK
ncbi:MAG: glycosyltransferase [Clostridia bacterium]|nr:glycosyltransferase [Clostridia bacterium]